MKLRFLFAAGLLTGIALSGVYYYVNRFMVLDKGGMINDPSPELLDGRSTYVDNDALWPRLGGGWQSEDGRWLADCDRENGLRLTLDGETVLDTPLSFTYLLPDADSTTALYPEKTRLRTAGSLTCGSIGELYFEDGEPNGTLTLVVCTPENQKNHISLFRVPDQTQ